MTAILSAIHHLSRVPEEKVVIVSDSKSSIQSLSSLHSKCPLINGIRSLCHKNQKEYYLCWVPSHVGITGNERADRLANEATKNVIQIPNKMTRIDAKSKIKCKMKERWAHRWNQNSNNKLKNITENLSPFPSSAWNNHKWERTLIRLRIGHTRLTHGYLLSGSRSAPTCEDCDDEVPLTVKHLLTECTAHRYARLRAFNSFTVTMKRILKDGDTSPNGPLAKYLTSIRYMESI